MRFMFHDPGPMIDGDLQVIPPAAHWIEDVLTSVDHPLSRLEKPTDKPPTRLKLREFLAVAPGGHQLGDADVDYVPAYHFWMLADPPIGDPAIRIVGGLGLRIGSNPEIELYSGHVGYHVYPAARGQHFAERACRLVLPLARRHGMERLWITCNPNNAASRRTCERLGARLIDIVPIPSDHPFRKRGETQKCRFLLELLNRETP